MPFQSCPQCQKNTLVPTGAFWCCTCCSTAITSQALSAIKATKNRRVNQVWKDCPQWVRSH